MLVLRNTPNALDDWLSMTHPSIPRDYVYFACGSVSQDTLNPFVSRIIIIYVVTDGRIHLKGCFKYGDTFMSSMLALNVWKNELSEVMSPMDCSNELVNVGDECTMDQVKQRIDWVLSSMDNSIMPFDVAFFTLLLIGPYVPEFYRIQMIKEKDNFDKIMSNIKTENEIAYFLQSHELASKLELLSEEPTVTDLQRVWNEWNLRIKPKVWLKVPMEEYPRQKHLYPGGYYHLILLDIAPWVWKHWTAKYVKRKQVKQHPGQMNHLFHYINGKLVQKSSISVSATAIVNSDDQFPPCIRAILSAPKFPQDRERQQFVRVCSAARVPLEYVKEKLEALNDKYPHSDGRKDVKSRWDYEAHYNGQYVPPRCESMDCPLAVGKSLDLKKVECYKLFVEKYPNKKKPNERTFTGPAKWLEW